MTYGLDLLGSQRACAIIRAQSSAVAVAAARAAIQGGMRVVEVTMNTPGALDAIRELAAAGEALVGAGTVLDSATADAVLEAGGRFIVSPHVDPSLIRHVVGRGALCIPGAMTPTEVHTARTAGAQVIKIFPAACVGGPEFVRLLRGPFSDVRLFPTGGVTPSNVREYLAAGAFAVGLTGWLFPKEALESGDWELVRQRAVALRAQLDS